MPTFDQYLEMAISTKNAERTFSKEINERIKKQTKEQQINTIASLLEEAIDTNFKIGDATKLEDEEKQKYIVELYFQQVFNWNLGGEHIDRMEVYHKYSNAINDELKKRYLQSGWKNFEVDANPGFDGAIYTLTK